MSVNVFSILEDLIKQFLSAVPHIVGALIFAFIGFLIAKAVSKVISTILRASGLDKVAERLNHMDMLQQYKIKIVPSSLLSRIIYYVLLMIFLIGATEILGMPVVSKLIGDLINYVPNLIAAAIVLLIGLFIADGLKGIALTTCKSLGIPSGKIIANFLFYFVFLTAAISALSQAKIDTDFIKSNLSILLGGTVAAFAIAYGLASRDAVANFLASFYVKPKFKVGDIITVSGFTGRIIQIDGNSATIQTDKSRIYIPLGKLAAENVEIHDN